MRRLAIPLGILLLAVMIAGAALAATPETTITDGPPDGSTQEDGAVTYLFTSDDPAASFECSLDSGAPNYSACASPKSYTELAPGNYTFRVRAIDAAGNVDASAATRGFSVPIPPDPQPYPGMRFHKVIGFQPGEGVDVTAAYVDQKYAEMMKPQYHGVNNDVKFTIRIPLVWSTMLRDDNVTPTHAQLRDHNWSGYVWNQAGQDKVANALRANCVEQGKCVISFQLNMAQGGLNNTAAVPQFMLNEDLAWIGAQDKPRIKFHKVEAQRYVADTYTAAFSRYADHPGIGSITLGEYWPESVKPADYDRVAYETGYENVLRDSLSAAARDANGNRVAIYQGNPMLSPDSFTCSDVRALGLGLATADPTLFTPFGEHEQCYSQLHGEVPMNPAFDAPVIDRGERFTWDGTPNPFGFQAGTTHQITMEQVVWYYGHCGPLPMDQHLVFKGANGDPDRMQAALDRFGPGGTQFSETCNPATGDWGGGPVTK